jgi:phage terminase large subunit GpA-like protein
LTSESFIKGHWVLGPNRRNEALDCRNYSRAAASIYGIDRFAEKHWRELEGLLPAAPAAPAARPARRVTVSSNWVQR